MSKHPPRRSFALLLAVAVAGQSAQAQIVGVNQLTRPALERDDLSRIKTAVDSSAQRYSVLRAPSRQLPWPQRRIAITLLTPEFTYGSNSQLPYSFNDGPIWQGRGINRQALAGLAITLGPLRIIAAPQFYSAENLRFQTIPYPQNLPEYRSVWATPFHQAPEGIDLPLRFGDQPLKSSVAGQSSLTLRLPVVELGLSTENVWWGPGKQNALLWSSQGEGVPAAFVRTREPIKTRAGTWDAWYTVGALRESDYFDHTPGNNRRSLGGIAINWQPPNSTGVEFGFARLVISADTLSGRTLGLPFRSVGRPNTVDKDSHRNADQITSLWARWAPPGAGFDAWVEWARFEEPASLRDLLESPGHSQGYTVGLQWAHPVRNTAVRLWGEATYLEPDPSLRIRPVGITYVSRSVAQSFTNRGQMLGAGIGPGASSQWVGTDWVHPRWRVGAYAARVRWDNAALFTPVVPEWRRQDISLINGLRVGGEWMHTRIFVDWAHEVRLNYLFQAWYSSYETGLTKGIDFVNNALTVTLSTSYQRSNR